MLTIPVIDLFAGPGGLGEGFSASGGAGGKSRFRIALSIEKDEEAHKTLMLRSFFRQFESGQAPGDYYRVLRGDIGIADLYESHPREARRARQEAWRQELGESTAGVIRDRIRDTLGSQERWILIGGPPCQAYSLVGRSRNKGNAGYDPAQDRRQTLYVEYLQILADHAPPVFVMENVKGILSATLESQHLFSRIKADLQDPRAALAREGRKYVGKKGRLARYRIYSLAGSRDLLETRSSEFVLRAEHYGVPQARHRVIIVGVREDIQKVPQVLAPTKRPTPARDALRGLPRVRSGLSRAVDSGEAWLDVLRSAGRAPWISWVAKNGPEGVGEEIGRVVNKLTIPRKHRGGEFVEFDVQSVYAPEWFLDPRIGGCVNHSARAHIAADLERYLFASCYASVTDKSPDLESFPPSLLPNHANVQRALQGSLFGDRFRVQVAGRPSTTVTSHIHKDGHYYIHYDPTQCRSLTVREAARLQTFPDNYFFMGGRTAQYLQVGNAVPPLLARMIADQLAHLLD